VIAHRITPLIQKLDPFRFPWRCFCSNGGMGSKCAPRMPSWWRRPLPDRESAQQGRQTGARGDHQHAVPMCRSTDRTPMRPGLRHPRRRADQPADSIILRAEMPAAACRAHGRDAVAGAVKRSRRAGRSTARQPEMAAPIGGVRQASRVDSSGDVRISKLASTIRANTCRRPISAPPLPPAGWSAGRLQDTRQMRAMRPVTLQPPQR